MILASSDATLNNTYLWVYIVLGILSLVGGAGVTGYLRSLKGQAVRNNDLDKLIDPKTGVMVVLAAHGKQLDEQDRQLAGLKNSVSPNGGNSREIGDTIQRIEKSVKALQVDFNKHLGASEEIHKSLRAGLNRKQDRGAA